MKYVWFQEAEKTAQKLGNIIYVAIANRMIGETLCALGEFEEAIKHQNIHLSKFLQFIKLCIDNLFYVKLKYIWY